MLSKILDGSKRIADKSKELVEVAKIKSSIEKIESEIEKRKTELSALTLRLYFERQIANPEIVQLCDVIKTLVDETERMMIQIEYIQNKGVICQFCSAENDSSTKFCNRCGRELTRPGGVICPSCNFGNVVGDLYCANCGISLPADTSQDHPSVSTCSKCGYANASGHRFCAKCGTGLLG